MRRADWVLLLATVAWGATFVLVQDAIAIMPPFTFIGARFVGAAILIAPLVLRQRVDWRSAKLWWAGASVGIWLSLGYILQTFGLLYTSAARAGFITGLSVCFVPFLAIRLLRQWPRRATLMGIAIAIVGLALLSFDANDPLNIGDVLLLGCAVAFAMQIIMISRHGQAHPPLALAWIQLSLTGVVNTLLALATEPQSLAMWQSPTVWLALIICTVFATAFAFVAQNYFQPQTTPTRAALIFITEPIFAALTAYWWTGTPLTGLSLMGCCLILLGTAVAEVPTALWSRLLGRPDQS